MTIHQTNDFVIVGGNARFKAHRADMAKVSPYFRDAFQVILYYIYQAIFNVDFYLTFDCDLRYSRFAQELGSLKLVSEQFIYALLWIETHLDAGLHKHHKLLNIVSYEENLLQTNRWVRNPNVPFNPAICKVLERKLYLIDDKVMDFKIRATWVRVFNEEVDIADLSPDRSRWTHHRLRFAYDVDEFAVDQNLVYIVSNESWLFSYDMETPSTQATFLELLPETFCLMNAYADNHVLYLYGTNNFTSDVNLITYEERSQRTLQYNFGLFSIHCHFPAMTVHEGLIYFKFHGRVIEANLQTQALRCVILLQETHTDLDNVPHLVKFGDYMYAFSDSGRYIKDRDGNREVTNDPEILSVDESETLYSYASACSTDEGLYVGLCNIAGNRPGSFKLMRGSQLGDFKCVSYVSDPMFENFLFDDWTSLVLRPNYGPLSLVPNRSKT